MQIDITNIIEMARADKEAKVKAGQRLEEISAEIKALGKEREELRNSLDSAYYLPRWQSDLLAMVSELIEQPTTTTNDTN